jgi:hypothetical protein
MVTKSVLAEVINNRQTDYPKLHCSIGGYDIITLPHNGDLGSNLNLMSAKESTMFLKKILWKSLCEDVSYLIFRVNWKDLD